MAPAQNQLHILDRIIQLIVVGWKMKLTGSKKNSLLSSLF